MRKYISYGENETLLEGHTTGFEACCNKYGDLAFTSLFLCSVVSPISPAGVAQILEVLENGRVCVSQYVFLSITLFR